jgi:hypothetical protein
MGLQNSGQMLKQVIRKYINDKYSERVGDVLGIPFSADTGLTSYYWKQLEKEACERMGISYNDYVEATEPVRIASN